MTKPLQGGYGMKRGTKNSSCLAEFPIPYSPGMKVLLKNVAIFSHLCYIYLHKNLIQTGRERVFQQSLGIRFSSSQHSKSSTSHSGGWFLFTCTVGKSQLKETAEYGGKCYNWDLPPALADKVEIYPQNWFHSQWRDILIISVNI